MSLLIALIIAFCMPVGFIILLIKNIGLRVKVQHIENILKEIYTYNRIGIYRGSYTSYEFKAEIEELEKYKNGYSRNEKC